MEILINQRVLTIPEPASVADALALFGAKPPFAVAVNGHFVARASHAEQQLQAGDRIDVVQPVVGG